MADDTRNTEATQADAPARWAADWLEGVASGAGTMSQRTLASVEARGGLEAVKAIAEQKGVHLLLLEDDAGKPIVAAGPRPFQVVC